MCTDLTFETLLDRLRNGDGEVARQIFQRFGNRLIALARSRLSPAIRQKVDPEDVMQSVFKSFFFGNDQGQFDLTDWDSLWSLLTVITLRKCGYRTRQFRAACRDVQREASRNNLAEDALCDLEAIAREANPLEAAMLAEIVESLFRGLEAGDRRILELALQGYKASEVSSQLGLAERSVYRFLERLKGKLERLSDENTAPSL
jgi:RNA polymerase sigma factor (sigma-70 family)